MSDFDDAAAEIVDGLGSPFVYFDHCELTQVTGIFSNAFQKVDGTRGPAVGSRRPELMIRSSVIAAPTKGDLLFKGLLANFDGDFDYEVVSSRADEEETVTTLILKKTA